MANDITNQVQPGDLLYFDFDGDGIIDHATIVTKVENGEIYYAGNTVRRFDQPLSESYESGNCVYIVRINDQIPANGDSSGKTTSNGGCEG